jgi:hypothetical protein
MQEGTSKRFEGGPLTNLRLVTPNPAGLRAALYRRYSDDVQNDRSIERQTADLEKAAPRLNLKLDKQLLLRRPGTICDDAI